MRSESVNAISVDQVSVGFESGEEFAPALSDVSFDVGKGECFGVVGRSGAGKSVLARSLLGLMDPAVTRCCGEVVVLDQRLGPARSKAWDSVRGRRVSLILPNPRSRLNPLLPVGRQLTRVVRAGGELGRRESANRALTLLRSVEMPDPASVMKMLPSELSGGMCQRVVIAMALANEPEIIIADEPTAGLDVTVQLQVLDLMKSLVTQKGASVVLMTRDLGIIAHYCTRVAVLEKGEIVEQRPVAELFDAPRTEASRNLLTATQAALSSAPG